MIKKNIEVVSEERDYDKYFKVDKALIEETSVDGNKVTYDRFKLTRPDSVAVIIYNSDNDTVVLIKKHRYPTHKKVTGDIYEIITGKIDEGEDHRQIVLRKVLEEVGYQISEDKLLYKSSFFISPEYSSEIIHLYAASVKNDDKVSDGGGVEGGHENIDIYHIPVSEFFNMFGIGEIVDAKTIIGANALWHLRNDNIVEIGLKYHEQLRLDKSKSIADQVINEEQEDNLNKNSNI